MREVTYDYDRVILSSGKVEQVEYCFFDTDDGMVAARLTSGFRLVDDCMVAFYLTPDDKVTPRVLAEALGEDFALPMGEVA